MKVTAPLFSLDASGSIGGAIVASKWKGRNYMRRLVIPSNPKSDGQTTNRAVMRFLSQSWALLTALQQADWNVLAAQGNYSPFNAYARAGMMRWTQWNYPQIHPTNVDSTVPATPTALSAAGGVGVISGTLSTVAAPGTTCWGGFLYANLTNDLVIAKGDLKVANYWEGLNGTGVNYSIAGLAPGSYYVKGVLVSVTGVQSIVFKSALTVVT
jgi:hypothetical protein